ncbi:MAG: GNAT family N-acetyltransferase [Nitrosopumilus sp.]|nr:GNAT family N-acetyltransferase [Nitrosopumilus sp.]
MELFLRESTHDDIPEILNLLYDLDRPRPLDDDDDKIFKNKISDYFLDSQKNIIVAQQEKRIVGVASIIYLQRLNRVKTEMYIPELIVTEKLRCLGIGKKLVQYCMELAKKKNCYRIRLESGNTRKESHKFYKSMGFEQSAQFFSKQV